jgi:type VI secretion system secreted protein Hcp
MNEQAAADLERIVAQQAREIAELKAKLEPRTTTRRNVLKGAGAVAGGLAAIGAIGAAGSAIAATPAGAAGWEAAPTYPGAQSVALFLELNGVEIHGDNRNQQDGREGSIECTYFQYGVSVPISKGSGQASGKRQHEPITIRKPIDQSTPLLFRGLVQNQAVEATFKFYKLGADNEQHDFYTIDITKGRIASINEISPDNENRVGDGASSFPLEQVTFTFQTIRWRFEPTAVEFQDTFNGRV